MDILYLVDRLEALVAESQRIPLTSRVLVQEKEILNLIDQLRMSLPDEIKQARRINQEKERILNQAHEEAKRIVAAAEEEANRLVNNDELIRAAEERAADIVQSAQEKAEQIRQGADLYAAEALHTLEEHLATIETEVARTMLSIRKGLEALGEHAEETQPHDWQNELNGKGKDQSIYDPITVPGFQKRSK